MPGDLLGLSAQHFSEEASGLLGDALGRRSGLTLGLALGLLALGDELGLLTGHQPSTVGQTGDELGCWASTGRG
jgi:hypothetical protein